MRDLLTKDGKPQNDLSTRLADNVVEGLLAYFKEPSLSTWEAATIHSGALQALSTLAVAEQLQALNGLLERMMEGLTAEESVNPYLLLGAELVRAERKAVAS